MFCLFHSLAPVFPHKFLPPHVVVLPRQGSPDNQHYFGGIPRDLYQEWEGDFRLALCKR